MRRYRKFYVWVLPVVWALTSFASLNYPGDEYALWVVSSMAGIWIFAFVDDGSVSHALPFVLLAGGAVLAGVGLLLDLLRAPKRRLTLFWVVVVVLFCVSTIASYPSYDRAISRNGSLSAYIFFSMNMGLYVTCLIGLLVMSVWRLTHRLPPPGHCPQCGYDLTGNVAGRCPECGGAM